MKAHYAAALALVGWYLMGPPVYGVDVTTMDPSAPLSKWNIEDSYDTARECREALQERRKASEHSSSLAAKMGVLLDTDPRYVKELECIATDDPRLRYQRK